MREQTVLLKVTQTRLGLTSLLFFHIFICCVSLIYIAQISTDQQIVLFDRSSGFDAALNVATFSIVALLFTFSQFSFGYFVGFYFFTMILGYLWILGFSRSHYDHSLAHISIFLSALAFLVPALFVTSPAKLRFTLSARSFDFLLSFILILSAATVAIGAFHNFKPVALSEMYAFRREIILPGYLKYAMGMVPNALLPFAFACFVMRRDLWRAGTVLVLLLLLYPVTLTKITLFAPFWLLFLVLLSKHLESKASVIFSLLLPTFFGVALVFLSNSGILPYDYVRTFYGTVNVRMIAMPSMALDVYNDFFSTHSLTHFCQISFLKPLIVCPYTQSLGDLMEEPYAQGSFNASLFATEGIASVGLWLAPLSALICGLVIGLGNRLSSGLPPKFILLSGGMLPQVFLNVPFTTMLLTNGTAILFLLWYVTPRSAFERKERAGRSIDASGHAGNV
jgi:hypothetical protein